MRFILPMLLSAVVLGCSNNFEQGDFTCREVWKKFEYIPNVAAGHSKYYTHTHLIVSGDKRAVSMYSNESVGGVEYKRDLIYPYTNCSNTKDFIRCKDTEEKSPRKDPMTKKDWVLVTNRAFELNKSSGVFTDTVTRDHADLEGRVTSTERSVYSGQCHR